MRIGDLRKLEPGTYLAVKRWGSDARACFVGIGSRGHVGLFLSPHGKLAVVGFLPEDGEWYPRAINPRDVLDLWPEYEAQAARDREWARQATLAAEAKRAEIRARLTAADGVLRAHGVGGSWTRDPNTGRVTLELEQVEAIAAALRGGGG